MRADQKEEEQQRQQVKGQEDEEDKEEEEVKEFEALGRRLNEMYLDSIQAAQKAQRNLRLKINKNENENENKCSCDNLLCYLALRKHDLSDLQLRLAEHGLSSLEMLESRVLVSIEQVLKHFGIAPVNTTSLCKVKFQSGSMMLAKRSELLFGQPSSKGGEGERRRTRIMVTLDASDIFQYELIEELLESGLDIVRINCAHNTKREWKLLIESIRSAEEQLVQKGRRITGRKCMILMDLGGPKIRTGPAELKSRPIKISVPEDVHDRPVRFAEGVLDSEANQTELVSLEGSPSRSFVIAISKIDYGGLGSLKIGQKITFRDAQDERLCTMTVLERLSPTKVRVGLDRTAWIKEGTRLECQPDSIGSGSSSSSSNSSSGSITDGNSCCGGGSSSRHSSRHDSSRGSDDDSSSSTDNNKCSFIVGRIKEQPVEITVQYGNRLRLYRERYRLGHTADASASRRPAAISCTHPEVLDQVMVGHRVFIDDGKIEGIVRSSTEEYLELEIISPKGAAAEIKSNKGMNFPDSAIVMPALTPEDISNLEFVVKHADMVALSFVHRPDDIYDLYRELSKLNHDGRDIGIVAKIETADSIHNLARILIAGLELELPKFGILIARGDLAVEVGFENLPFVQEDILCLCEAAHIPVILGTQILESLAESGLRTRPEVTDAIMGQRAECVMLNNGVHIVEAVKTLAELLSVEERHQIKKRHLFREFFTAQHNVL